MARGWESKAVEAQIEEGERRVFEATAPARASLQDRARQQRLESLRLSRSRILQQLDRARQSAHREILAKGLRAIEQEIEEVSTEIDPRH